MARAVALCLPNNAHWKRAENKRDRGYTPRQGYFQRDTPFGNIPVSCRHPAGSENVVPKPLRRACRTANRRGVPGRKNNSCRHTARLGRGFSTDREQKSCLVFSRQWQNHCQSRGCFFCAGTKHRCLDTCLIPNPTHKDIEKTLKNNDR